MVNLWIIYLIGGLEHFLCVAYTGNVIIPIDEVIFFTGVGLNHQPDNYAPCMEDVPTSLP